MSVILILIPVSVLVAAGFLAGFIWAVRSGQYDDTTTPSMRMLADDAPTKKTTEKLSKSE
jgi:cbb3-type cytochrome oxidase maturation protein